MRRLWRGRRIFWMLRSLGIIDDVYGYSDHFGVVGLEGSGLSYEAGWD